MQQPRDPVDIPSRWPHRTKFSSTKLKTVSFSDDLEITHFVPTLMEYSLKEIANTWYTDDEMRDFRRSARVRAGEINYEDCDDISRMNQTYFTSEKISRMVDDEATLNTLIMRLNVSQSVSRVVYFTNLALQSYQHCRWW